MRYMIYEASKERLRLQSELDYMNDYVHLESIRLNGAFEIQMKVEGNVGAVSISPLLLFPF